MSVFKFKLGDRVRATASGQAGEIVEGEYDGPVPPRGAYTVTYQVRTEGGNLFTARDVELESVANT